MKKNNVNLLHIILFTLCLFVIAFQSLFSVFQQQEKFFAPTYHTRYQALRTGYYSSQYIQKKNPVIVPDEVLESFAGGEFLRGINPILIVHDQPPLGRYLIAGSILLFDNENVITLVVLAISILGIFLIGKQVLSNNFLALIPVGLFVNEPLFINKFNFTPLLEPLQLPFIIFSLYFFISGVSSKRYLHWFVLTSFCVGGVISTRFFVVGLVLLAIMFCYLLFFERVLRKTLFFCTTVPVILIVLFLSYLRTIQLGYSLVQILGIQKYILVYHKSAIVVPFTFWDLILFNRWHTWWADRAILSDPQWIILWPVSMGATLMYGLLGLLRKIVLSKPELILLGWVVGYSLMLSVGYSSTRYFLPLLPFLYILATASGVKGYLWYHRRKNSVTS